MNGTNQAVRNINAAVAVLIEIKIDKSLLYTAIGRSLGTLSAQVNYAMNSLEYLWAIKRIDV